MSYNPANYPIADSNVLRGSLLMNFDNPNNDPTAYYTVTVNGNSRDQEYVSTDNFFSTYLYVGDVVNIVIYNGQATQYIGVKRTDFTTDSVYGDNGINIVNVASISNISSITFTATTVNTSYNFEYSLALGTEELSCGDYYLEYTGTTSVTISYRDIYNQVNLVTLYQNESITVCSSNVPTCVAGDCANLFIGPPPSPSPTPSITPTISLTPSVTSSAGASPTPTPTYTPTPSVTPTITPTINVTPTPSSTPLNPSDAQHMIIYTYGQKVSSGVGVVYYWLSNDYGNNWIRYSQTVTAEFDPYTASNNLDFDIDYSGQNLVASNINAASTPGEYFFQSNNFGVSFIQKFDYSIYGVSEVLQTIMSSDSKVIVSLVKPSYFPQNVEILLSTDYGTTFTNVIVSSAPYYNTLCQLAITMDQTGQRMFVGGCYDFTNSTYQTNSSLSTDYGVTWTNINSRIGHSIPLDPSYLLAVNYGTFSLSGQYLFVWTEIAFSDTNTVAKLSNDYGVTFSGITINGNNYFINKMNMSGDGSIMYAAVETGIGFERLLFKSTNYGLTWTNIKDLTGFDITSLTVSSSGKYIILTAGLISTIYKSDDYGSTFTTVSLPSPASRYAGSQMSRFYGPNPTPTPTPSITPTNTPTPTLTPTPSSTPVPITIKYRYIGNNGNTSTKTVSSQRVTWGGETFTISNRNWTTSTNTGQITLGTSYVFSGAITGYRNICKTGTSQTIDSYTVNVYINGTLYKTFTNNTNTSITTCPTLVYGNRQFTNCDFTKGDTVLFEWIDNML